MNAVTAILLTMVVDYIRVRKSNMKELQEIIAQRRSDKLVWIATLAIPALVLVVALVGLVTAS